MAIVVEEEKRKKNWFAIVAVVLLIALFFAVVYYLFFIKPSLIEMAVPSRLQSVSELSRVDFRPEELTNSQAFRDLKQYVSTLAPVTPGRKNPFLPTK